MENDYSAKVNLTLLQEDTKKSLSQIAELVDINSKAIYKWAYSKEDGGSRPTYNAIKLLKEHGASDMALFGIEGPSRPAISDEQFAGKVKEVLLQLIK